MILMVQKLKVNAITWTSVNIVTSLTVVFPDTFAFLQIFISGIVLAVNCQVRLLLLVSLDVEYVTSPPQI